ncbi:MAG: CheR family methyltransferase, partial [Holosporales bacterium]
IYTQFEVQRGLPIQMLIKYFKQNGNDWQLVPEIRQKVQFVVHNLLDDFRGHGRWDIVFCRNVLIYFDPPTKSLILDKIAAVLEPKGYLILGGAETVLGISNKFQLVEGRRGMYQLI